MQFAATFHLDQNGYGVVVFVVFCLDVDGGGVRCDIRIPSFAAENNYVVSVAKSDDQVNMLHLLIDAATIWLRLRQSAMANNGSTFRSRLNSNALRECRVINNCSCFNTIL